MKRSRPECPRCGSQGRLLGARTLTAQLRPAVAESAGTLDGYSFCGAAECEVVYFAEAAGRSFLVTDLALPVFQKSTLPERFACYCFQHSVGSLKQEVRKTGASQVPDEIKVKCRAGLDDCALKNPQGVCCLGNVRSVVQHAVAESKSDLAAARSGARLRNA